jgi:hypothetical protein
MEMAGRDNYYVNDFGIRVRGYESALGGLYHSEDVALNVSGEDGSTHALVRFADVAAAFEALEHITAYDSHKLGAISESLARSVLSTSTRRKGA